MMQISAKTTGSARVIGNRLQKAVRKQIPFAASQALNDTGKTLVSINKREMKRVFDNPVPYTLNAFYLKRAMKADLSVAVRRKDKPAGKHYLDIQKSGGVRPQKAFEKMVQQRVAYPGIVGSVIPIPGNGGVNAKGNVNMGEVNRALAGLNASFSTTAYTRDRQRKAESKRALSKRPTQYFVRANEGGTKGGIFKRTGKRKAKMVFLISDAMPSYRGIYKFDPPLRKHAMSYFPAKFKRRLAAAYRTMRV